MKYLVLIVAILLSGCTIPLFRNSSLSIICYKDDQLLPFAGGWASDQIYYKCNRRRVLDFDYRFGAERNNDIITDFKIDK
jgi:hypothetical protein